MKSGFFLPLLLTTVLFSPPTTLVVGSGDIDAIVAEEAEDDSYKSKLWRLGSDATQYLRGAGSSSGAQNERYLSRFQQQQQRQQQRKQNAAPENPNAVQGSNDSKHKDQSSLSALLIRAGWKGIGGGLTGAAAGVVQVLTLMWLRTVISYQMRYGTSFEQALRILYNEGGIRRFYQGLSFAIIQAPLSRFGSVAANDGINALLASMESTRHWGAGRSTLIASFAVGLWRMFLMPIDTCKTILQVDSSDGFKTLLRKVKAGKIHVLYQGAFANALASIVAHYPWFFTYNQLLNSKFFQRSIEFLKFSLLKNALVGFLASIVSDTITNAIRVVKTTKQAMAAKHAVTYGEAIRMIWTADGWKGLFGRGLRARILSNGLQSIIFVVVWRGLQQRYAGNSENNEGKENDEKVN